MKKLISITLGTFLALPAFAAEKEFQVFSTKTITADLERMYGQDGTAFANIFCNAEAKIVMIVDSRLRELDGKNFQFSSYQDCIDARANSRNSVGLCKGTLIINTDTFTARFQTAVCP